MKLTYVLALLLILVACKSPSPTATSIPTAPETTRPAVPATPPGASPTASTPATATTILPIPTPTPKADGLPERWEPSGGPPGGRIEAVAVDPANLDKLYAAGAGGAVYSSEDGGETWTPGTRLTWPGCIFSDLIADIPNALYAINDCRGVFKSGDAGATWSQVGEGIEEPIVLMALSPHAPEALLAANQDGQVYRSLDGAASWQTIGAGLPPERIRDLAISGPATYWATTSNGKNGTLYRSDGQGWYEVFFPQPPGTETTNILVDPNDPNILYIGLETVQATGFGPQDVAGFRSIDGGYTWIPLYFGVEELGARITLLGIGPQTGVLYASDGGLLASVDGGDTWNRLEPASALANGSRVRQIAIDPNDDHVLYLSLGSDGIAKSQDGGQNWRTINQGLNSLNVALIAPHPTDPAVLYAASAAGEEVFKSIDYGDSWIRLESPDAGRIAEMVVDPNHPDTLYQVSASGQAYRSDDGGVTWSIVWSDLRFSSVQALAVAPLDPNRIYANKRGFGLFRSDDGGASWRSLPQANVDHTEALAVHPNNPDFVLSGDSRQPLEEAVTLGRSRDGGETWEPSLVLSDALGITAAAFDPRLDLWFPRGKQPPDPTRLYAASVGPRGVLWFSNDAGDSWRPLNQDLNFSNVQALAVTPHQPGVVYAATRGGGTWRTRDSGESWQRLPGDPSAWAAAIAVDPSNHNVLYIADRLSPRLYRSGDGGTNWETVFDAGGDYQRLDVLAPAPSDPTILFVSALETETPPSGTLFRVDVSAPAGEKAVDVTSDLPGIPSSLAVHRRDPRRLFATLPDGGVWKTVDDGASWRAVKTGLPQVAFSQIAADPISPDTLYLTGESNPHVGLDPDEVFGIWKSTDDGNTWKKVGGTAFGWISGPVSAITFQPDDQQVMYAAGENGIYFSPDRGETWTGINGRLPFIQMNAVASDGQTLYAGSSGAGVFAGPIHPLIHTADWGRHSNLAVPIDHLQITLHPSDPQTLYVGASPGGIFKTSDGGVTWRAYNRGLPDLDTADPIHGGHYDLVAAPTAPERLYLGLPGHGVYRSDDGAITWNPAHGEAGELQSADVKALQVHPDDPDVAYAAAQAAGGGVWRTVNGGRMWVPFDEGLPPGLGVRSLALGAEHQAPTATLQLYAGSYGYGVYRRDASHIEGAGWSQLAEMGQPQDEQKVTLLIHPSDANVLYLGTSRAGVYKTGDGGQSWHEHNVGLGVGGILTLVFHPDDPEILYAGTPGGIVHSVDGGATWDRWAAGWPSERRVLSIAFDPSTPNTLYACAHSEGAGSTVMKSTDGGAAWSEIIVGLDPSQAFYQVLVDRFDPNRIYLATNQDGVYLSRDGGATWVSWNEGLWNRVAGGYGDPLSDFMQLSADGRILYLGTDGSGVWRRPAAGRAQGEEK